MQCQKVKLWSCRQPSVFPVGSTFVLGKIWLCWLTFHGKWHLLQVRRQPPCSGGFVCLGSHCRSLANRTGATIEGVVARCASCSSKLCLLFDPFEPRSLQQRRLHKNYNFGTPMNNIVECFWRGIVQCQKVKLRSCRYPPVFPRGSRFVLGKIWLLTLCTLHTAWGFSLCQGQGSPEESRGIQESRSVGKSSWPESGCLSRTSGQWILSQGQNLPVHRSILTQVFY